MGCRQHVWTLDVLACWLRECSSKTSVHTRSIKEATVFCIGAYQDALWFRKRSWQEQVPMARIRGSASACLLLLIGMFFSTWGMAHVSPGAAAAMSKIEVYPWRVSDQRTVPCDCAFDLIAERRSLQTTQLFFDGFSRYKITQETVWAESMQRTEWTVALAGSDFFTVLHLPLRPMEYARTGPDKLPQIVLSTTHGYEISAVCQI